MHRRIFLLALMFGLAACERPTPPAFKASDLTGASFARDFALTDHHGQARQLADFRGRVVILFFGYTACPDVCPTTLARLATAMQQLGTAAARVQVLFVTLDPERDSAERLAQYVPWFHPDFLGLRAAPEEIRLLAAEFRVFASRQTVPGEVGYVIDHSAGAYVFDPSGHLRLYVQDSLAVDDLVADLRLLLAGN